MGLAIDDPSVLFADSLCEENANVENSKKDDLLDAAGVSGPAAAAIDAASASSAGASRP